MTAEAKALAQALLDHQRRVRRGEGAPSPTLESGLISYSDLCDQAGVPQIKAAVGPFLREIAVWCHANHWPPLNALAVNHQTGKPGGGYDKAPRCSLSNWRAEAAACLEFTCYPGTVL